MPLDPHHEGQAEASETDAEMLAAHQLDLLAQLEAQLRGVHHMMRRIERLRSATSRSGPEVANGEQASTLNGLSDEVAEIDGQLATQQRSLEKMQEIIMRMRERVSELLAQRRRQQTGNQPSPPDA